MRPLLLTLFIGLWSLLQVPVVLAGTRAVVEGPAQVEDELCRGWDGNLYRRGARECLPVEAPGQSPTPAEAADSLKKTDSAQAAEGSGSQHRVLFPAAVMAVLVAVIALVAFAGAAIAAAWRNNARRPSAPETKLVAPPLDTADQSRPGQPEMEGPERPVECEDRSAGPAPGEAGDVRDQPAHVHGEAALITVWTGAPCTVEFTYKDLDGDWSRNTVDITSIMRDPQNGGWHLRGFCHLWREERDYDGTRIATKILYKSRRWNLEDWITAIAGKEARGS
jgi:hypothetical protein